MEAESVGAIEMEKEGEKDVEGVSDGRDVDDDIGVTEADGAVLGAAEFEGFCVPDSEGEALSVGVGVGEVD